MKFLSEVLHNVQEFAWVDMGDLVGLIEEDKASANFMAADRNPATLAKHYTLKCNEVDHISGEP